jgi:hypothetical protein
MSLGSVDVRGIAHRIEESAFSESALKEIEIPFLVGVLGKGSFSLCKSLERVTFSDSSILKCIEESAFFGSGLKTIEIPSSVVDLGKSAFSYCKRLKTVTFKSDSQLKEIEQSTFSWSGLKVFEIPSLVTSIDGSAFGGVSIKNISVSPEIAVFCVCGSFLKHISSSTICRYFGAERSVVIPSSVRILGQSSFSACKSLKSIRFEDGSQLDKIEEFAFSESGLKSIVSPATVAFIDGSAFAGCALKSMSIGQVSEAFLVSESFLLDVGRSKIYRCFGTGHSVVIRAEVRVLERSSFSACKSLERIRFDKGSKLEQIEESAFRGNDLKSVTIPSTVIVLGKDSFCDCSVLESVMFEDGSKLKRIEHGAFRETGDRKSVV